MKNCIILLFIFFLSACRENEQYKPKKSKGIPNALQERSVDVSGLNKHKDTDLVEVLYKELIDKDPALKHLENDINKLNESKADSLKPFTLYEKNNQEYYATYEKHLQDIQDSVLRRRMKKILDSSLLAHRKKFATHQKVLDSTNDLYKTLSDLHWILKLSKTLAVIQNYQDQNMPDTATLKRTLRQLEEAIQTTDSLMKVVPVKNNSAE